MSCQSRGLRWAAFIGLFLCLLGLDAFHTHISRRRGDLNVAQPYEPYAAGGVKSEAAKLEIPVEELTGVIFGGLIAGFRHQAANITYWRMQRYWEDGHWPRVLGMLKLTCFLDPQFLQAWSMLGWHQAYNMAAEEDSKPIPTNPPERYVRDGMETYRRGLSFNPGSYNLYEDGAWTAFDKAGDMRTCTELAEKAILTWDPDPTVTKAGPLIYGRMRAHALERVPDMYGALDAYRQVLRLEWSDAIGIGATMTIRERYIPAIHAWERGDPDRAIALLAEVLHRRTTDPFVPELLGRIYEAKGDKHAALAAWEFAGQDWRSKNARTEVYRLLKETGRLSDYQRPAIDQADPKVLYNAILWKQTPRGMGILINVRQDKGGELTSGRVVQDREVVRIDPSEQGAKLPPGRARWYLNGVLIAERTEAPYTCRLDLAPFEPGGESTLVLKADFIPQGGGRALWDAAQLQMPWARPKSAPRGAPGGAGPPPGMGQKMDMMGKMQQKMQGKMPPGPGE